MSNLFDPRGRVIPRKPKPFHPPPENQNFKADFHINIGKKILRSVPYKLTVLGSIAPGGSSVTVAIELRFRDGVVISGGPLHMVIKEDDDEGSKAPTEESPGGDKPDAPGV